MEDPHGRSYLKDADLSAEEYGFLLDLAAALREEERAGAGRPLLAGKNVALLFAKTSTRTRSTFEVATFDLGGHHTYLGPGETQSAVKESAATQPGSSAGCSTASSSGARRTPTQRAWRRAPACRSGTAPPTSGTPPGAWPTYSRCGATRTGRPASVGVLPRGRLQRHVRVAPHRRRPDGHGRANRRAARAAPGAGCLAGGRRPGGGVGPTSPSPTTPTPPWTGPTSSTPTCGSPWERTRPSGTSGSTCCFPSRSTPSLWPGRAGPT